MSLKMNKLLKKILITSPLIIATSAAFVACVNVKEVKPEDPIKDPVLGKADELGVVETITNAAFSNKNPIQLATFKRNQLTNTSWIDDYNSLVKKRNSSVDENEKKLINMKLDKLIQANWYWILKNTNKLKWKFDTTYSFPKNENGYQVFSEKYLKEIERVNNDKTVKALTFTSTLKEPSGYSLIDDTETSRGNYYLNLDDHYFFYFSFKKNSSDDTISLVPRLYRFEKDREPSYKLLSVSWHNVLLHANSKSFVDKGTLDFETLTFNNGPLLMFQLEEITK
ncbi:hypothetical protein CJJ23_01420 [Mycoplasmopsis agassizii]|uniref:Lipoprotein n=2 Tax=Mycoplasmopsis agassizii TaxID=33922 RepID=A0A269TJK4_9BACT|nr:hypothetical protein CJJ23_01420 [Mycoplasmopsis agassizii]